MRPYHLPYPEKIMYVVCRNDSETSEQQKYAMRQMEGGLKDLYGNWREELLKVLEEFNDISLLEIKLLTGRTHQIRAHLEFLGTPIVGDEKYCGSQRIKPANLSSKLHLHAFKIDLSSIYNKKQ